MLLGIWPMLDTGEARAAQIVPLALLVEVKQRLRLETRRVFIVGTTGVTTALIAYALIVAHHGGTWRNAAIWITLLILIAATGVIRRYRLQGSRPPLGEPNLELPPRTSTEVPLAPSEYPSASVSPTVPLPMSDISSLENPLTKRQREILRLVEGRKPTREIADTLGISEETVKAHLRDIAKMLGTHTRFQASRTAREHGWLN